MIRVSRSLGFEACANVRPVMFVSTGGRTVEEAGTDGALGVWRATKVNRKSNSSSRSSLGIKEGFTDSGSCT